MSILHSSSTLSCRKIARTNIDNTRKQQGHGVQNLGEHGLFL